jgi:hypothetical protein
MKRSNKEVVFGFVLLLAMMLLFPPHLTAAGKNIDNIEQLIQKIEKTKVIGPDDDAMLDKYFEEHAQNVEKEIAEIKGDKDKLLKMRQERKGQDKRVKSIENKINAIEKKLKSGEIMLSKEVLQKMNKQEIDEFKNSLTPNGVKKYEKLYPDLFKTGKVSESRPQSGAPLYGQASCDERMGGFIADLFFTPAYAGVVCSSCAPLRQECLARCCSSCKWYRPGCCACKSACENAYAACTLTCYVGQTAF